MNHIMLDLETLDTASSAVVVSIGAVAFDPHTNALGVMSNVGNAIAQAVHLQEIFACLKSR